MRALWLYAALALPAALAAETGEWPQYGADPGGSRYSTLDEINRDNVRKLELAWTFRTGETGEGYARADKLTFEATPVSWQGTLFLSTGFDRVFAVDAATGAERWRFDPGVDPDTRYAEVASRGVALWHDPLAPPEAACTSRVFIGTLDGRLIAIDARTGEACRAFGRESQVDLTAGVRLADPEDYTITSPPAVLGNTLIVGSAIGDNRAVEVERGIVRALDARSGAVLWSWDPIPTDAGDPAYATWAGDSAQRTGAANAWSVISVDHARNLVYVPTSAPSPDFYGGERPGANRYANSLVALNGDTGEVVWHFQLVHHDLWDYDLASQPVLVELARGGRRIPAVVQASKMGMLFVFDRRSGEPLFPIEERPVPQGGVPGEQVWPTQPFSALPALVDHSPVTEDDAWGLTPWDRRSCRQRIREHRSDGIYTPPSLQGTIQYPGYAGGSNWGSVAFDPERQYVIANTMQLPMVVTLIPRDRVQALRAAGELGDYSEQRGTPYVMTRGALLSRWGIPCTPPPWGTLAAVDLRAGTIAWQVPLGTIEDDAPALIPNIRYGMPNIGGPIATAGALVFIAAATDHYLRAFDVDTGEELWRGRLPAGGQATPMTYRAAGRQFVAIAAGGHGPLGTSRGDFLVAFALPQD